LLSDAVAKEHHSISVFYQKISREAGRDQAAESD